MGKVVFDLETVHTAEEVGGWRNIHLMRMSVGVLYDYAEDAYHVFREFQVEELVNRLQRAELVIGFNIVRFDYRVLSYYARRRYDRFRSLDLLQEIERIRGHRVALDALAQATLGERKSGDGLQAIEWYRRREWDRLIEYCKQDVVVTRRIYEFGRDKGYILIPPRRGLIPHKMPVDWP